MIFIFLIYLSLSYKTSKNLITDQHWSMEKCISHFSLSHNIYIYVFACRHVHIYAYICTYIYIYIYICIQNGNISRNLQIHMWVSINDLDFLLMNHLFMQSWPGIETMSSNILNMNERVDNSWSKIEWYILEMKQDAL